MGSFGSLFVLLGPSWFFLVLLDPYGPPEFFWVLKDPFGIVFSVFNFFSFTVFNLKIFSGFQFFTLCSIL